MKKEPANEEYSDSASPEANQYTPDQLQDTGNKEAGRDINLDLVLDIPVNVSLRVGSAEVSIRELVKLVEGSVVALDRHADEPLDLLVNGTLVARGEIVVVDENFGVRLTEVVTPLERIESLNK